MQLYVFNSLLRTLASFVLLLCSKRKLDILITRFPDVHRDPQIHNSTASPVNINVILSIHMPHLKVMGLVDVLFVSKHVWSGN